MEQRLANTWRMTVNEKKFIESALLSGLRVDGRNVYDYRKLSINFGKEDGSAEVHLGQTRVMGFVTSQLVQPYRDRPNEGSLSIFTEFSPMADPSFEPGRPGEFAVELGRVIDRGLRESRAVDTESLCILAGKLVWAIRIDIHILDNGGNLVDAANVAALAALLTFRRPECSLGGENGQEVIVHPPEAREPLPLIIHHLPIAVTFAFFSDESTLVVDPTHQEEAVMAGRMTATLNTNGDICAIQKAGGEGVPQSVIMHCLRIAATKAADITVKIRDTVEAYNTERALRKIKRHSAPVALDVSGTGPNVRKNQVKSQDQRKVSGSVGSQVDKLKPSNERNDSDQSNDIEGKMVTKSFEQGGTNSKDGKPRSFIGGPSSWDPYSRGVDSDFLKLSLASRETSKPSKKQRDLQNEKPPQQGASPKGSPEDIKATAPSTETSNISTQTHGEKTLKDAVKPRHKRKKKAPSAVDGT
ncbi:exosome complex component RRP45A-like isoform X1 [Rhodamnia argentea]|uniref:Exosome complex component RRP45A-like isoform X1 n=2 Tax=Rhodamnia argentea TaxID=178133 RepID=A0A8B8PX96_9MYRT|nr:exosome complex component RRP45A-like isoform X1 [Rhodamnia argentea]XP_048131785.1 exosome complex component RRP45A-like isoform X1 [Rhodamnia argentea]